MCDILCVIPKMMEIVDYLYICKTKTVIIIEMFKNY